MLLKSSKSNAKILEEIIKQARKNKASLYINNPIKLKKSKNKEAQTKEIKKIKSNVNTIFKVIGWRYCAKSLQNTLHYISKNADILVNECGELINKESINKEVQRFKLLNEVDTLTTNNNGVKKKQLNRQFGHFIFSLPNNEEENKEKFQEVAKSLADIFVGFKIVYAIHNNTKHQHMHFVIHCQNDIYNKKLRLQTKDLFHINEKLFNICKELNMNLVQEQNEIKKPKIKDKTIKQTKLPDFVKKSAPLFASKYINNNFEDISCNNSTLNKLRDLGMDKENIKKFLWLYEENKKLAIYSVNKMPFIFSLKEKVNNFTLRKVSLKKSNER